jgi:ribokinase
MEFDVICFGALNMDYLFKVDKIAKEDEEYAIRGFKRTPGGAAANTAVGLARLGLKAGYLGKTSDDRNGGILINEFAREKVDTTRIIVSKSGRTGVIMGYIDKKGQRALYALPGINDAVKIQEIDIEYATSANFLHLTPFVGEKPFETQKQLVELVSRSKTKISFDPGDLYARKGLSALKPMIGKSFLVSLTEKELKLLTGRNYCKGSEILLNVGAQIVAVKRGGKGCYVSNREENHTIKPFRVKVVDTTGAGEAFSAGFLYGLVKNLSLCECGRIANFIASRCIMRIGARSGLPFENELICEAR